MRGHVGMGSLVALVAATAVASADRALDKPAFTATPRELLAAASAARGVAADASAVVLRREQDTSYDAQGRATVRERWIYAVRSVDPGDDGDEDDWGTVRAAWSPFYQDRPVLRARVIGPSGAVVELDPAKITEASGAERAAGAGSDVRLLEAALPPLDAGSVVEYEIATVDREPLPGGRVDLEAIDCDSGPTSTVIAYSAPVGKKLHRVERKLPRGVRVHHGVARGRERWTYQVTELPACEPFEAGAPSDVRASYVGAAPAASWQAVARSHRALVDQRIAGGAFELPAALPRGPSLDTVAQIVAWLHRGVHHTGAFAGFGATSLWPPSRTLQYGSGDAQDMAVLLVAALRQVQIRADLVLLAARWRSEIDPDLPGIAAFGHALVRARLGARDVWIDPLEVLARPGQLPVRDQGRRALVIADDTTALITTPLGPAGDNRIREVRSFAAAGSGPSRLVMVTRPTGAFEADQRAVFRDLSGDARDEHYGAIAEDWFGGALDRVIATPAGDLATPFEVALVVKQARRVFSDRERLHAYLYPRSVLKQVPGVLLEASDGPRVHDFAWDTPHVYEVENRITVPAGFALPADAGASDRDVAVGPATFRERRRVEGQTLIVSFELDTGKPRLSPAEFTALQAGLHTLGEETVHVMLDRTAWAFAEAGKLHDAVVEAQRLSALHPAEAVHHALLAEILIRAGAGEAARREARRAVALAPGEADPLVVLGWVLRHDRLGRDFMYDWDRPGAIAALRRARALDPRHIGALAELARVLERDSGGALYERDADLRGATELWREVVALDRGDDRDAEHALALAQVLIWSGQDADAETAARAAEPSVERDRWIVAAVAGARGAPAAIQAATDLRSGTERGELIGHAAGIQMLRQRYDLARALYDELGSPSSLPPVWTRLLARVTRHPDVPSGASDPATAVTDLWLTLADPERKTPVFWDAALESELRTTTWRRALPTLERFSASRLIGDVLQSEARIRIAGDAGLWRADVSLSGAPMQIYLALDRGVAKVIGMSRVPAALGRYVLSLGAGSEARARRLLDWLRADVDRSTERTAVLFRRVWGSGLPTTGDAIQRAAAVLAGASDADRAIAILLRCAGDAAGPLACREVLASAYLARERWADAVVQLDALGAAAPDDAAPFLGRHAGALVRCGRFDDADRLLDAALAKDPDHEQALVARIDVARERGQLAEALRRADAIVQRPRPSPRLLNGVAWFRLAAGADLPGAATLAHRAVAAAPDSYAERNTLAALEAELGELDRAVVDNRAALAMRPSGEPGDPDWYVAARIDEELGLTGDAAAIYTRIARPGAWWQSTRALAATRLAVLRHSR